MKNNTSEVQSQENNNQKIYVAIAGLPGLQSGQQQSNSRYEEKWYNNSLKLCLSILLWPMLVYGIYKTNLMTKKTKQIIAGVFVVLIIIGSFNQDGNSSSFSSSVRQSPWDNSVDCVESYLKHHYLRDPDSYESIHWDKVQSNANGTFRVTHTFSAKNGFGGRDEQTMTFTIASDGVTVISAF